MRHGRRWFANFPAPLGAAISKRARAPQSPHVARISRGTPPSFTLERHARRCSHPRSTWATFHSDDPAPRWLILRTIEVLINTVNVVAVLAKVDSHQGQPLGLYIDDAQTLSDPWPTATTEATSRRPCFVPSRPRC